MELKIKKVKENAILPTRGDEEAAGIDLYACLDDKEINIPSGCSYKIPSGISCEFPEGYFGLVLPRIMVFTNNGGGVETIKNGERLAQMILLPYVIYNIVETGTLSETERGEGGFGSTGK